MRIKYAILLCIQFILYGWNCSKCINSMLHNKTIGTKTFWINGLEEFSSEYIQTIQTSIYKKSIANTMNSRKCNDAVGCRQKNSSLFKNAVSVSNHSLPTSMHNTVALLVGDWIFGKVAWILSENEQIYLRVAINVIGRQRKPRHRATQ